MRLVAALTVMALLPALAGCGEDPAVSGPPHSRDGRYIGIGVFKAGDLWRHMIVTTPPGTSAAATIDDDDQLIAVVDSKTGEVRQCGNFSGYCISINPWANPVATAPASLKRHLADLRRDAERTTVMTDDATAQARPKRRTESD